MTDFQKHLDLDESGLIQSALTYLDGKIDDLPKGKNEVLKVVQVLLPLRPDPETIVAIILCDAYFLGILTPEKVKSVFGPQVLTILESLQRLSKLSYGGNDKKGHIENLRKMFITLAKDVRVILIWLARRLIVMKSLDCHNITDRSVEVSKETMAIYVPIASRLGFYRMKTELEDLAFFYLYPEEYNDLDSEIKEYGASNSKIIDHVAKELSKFLEGHNIKAKVSGRVKSIYSIYRKLKRKGLSSLTDLYDFYALRVVLPGEANIDVLYSVLGLIHSEWKPLSSRFKDYVAVPKPNGYKSLHTVVLGLGPKAVDKPVEIQIRNEEMHREAEFGFASHWIYKSGYKPQVEWIKGLKNLHEFFDANAESVKEVELDVFKDRIFVLTPRGDIKDLPANSVPIDFAYSVHTEVGNRCVMAKVNSNIVPLDFELNNGDVVEIITKKDSEPKLKWLAVVKSNFAKLKIKQWFNSQNRESNIKNGRELLNAQLERLGKPVLDQQYSILKNYAGQNLSLPKRESLVEEVGRGGKMASDVVRKVYPYEKNLVEKFVDPKQLEKEKAQSLSSIDLENEVIVGGETGLPIKMASCCSPRFGSKIVGYVTRGNRISIHRANCRLLDGLSGERLLMARWKGQNLADRAYQVWIRLVVASRIGLINDVSSVIASFGINISDIVIKDLGSGMNETCLLLDLNDLNKFDLLLDKLETVEGVMKAVRAEGFKKA